MAEAIMPEPGTTHEVLKEAAHSGVNRLFDALAALEAARAVSAPGDPVSDEEAGRIRRLIGLADGCVREVIEDLALHI